MLLIVSYDLPMNLSDQIGALRGSSTFSEFSKKTKVNRQTLTELERGESVKLSTLKLIAENCGISQMEWIYLLIGWIRAEIGDENFSLLTVSPAMLPWASGHTPTPKALFTRIFAALSDNEQRQILATMLRKPVRSCLPALNRAVKQQRAETRRLLSAIFAKKLRAKKGFTPNDVSGLIMELQQRELLEDVTNNSDWLREHELRESQEKLADQLLSEVIHNPDRRLRERRLSRRTTS